MGAADSVSPKASFIFPNKNKNLIWVSVGSKMRLIGTFELHVFLKIVFLEGCERLNSEHDMANKLKMLFLSNMRY